MNAMDTPVENTVCFQLKGGLFTLTAIQLLTTELSMLKAQLEQKILQAPKFFQNAPVVIDLQRLPKAQESIDFASLLLALRENKLIPVGIRGGTAAHQAQATALGLACLAESRPDTAPAKTTAPKATTAQTLKPSVPNPETSDKTPTRLITQPVRSGQQIYARGGDLLIMASVSHGAELLADGHIHVYGPLRGRALAGVSGDQNARIFCQSLEAELVSIAGQYRVSEDLKESLWKAPAQIALENNTLKIEALCDKQ